VVAPVLYTNLRVPRRTWIAFNGTWFGGGQTRVDDVKHPDLQRNSRLGATVSVPISSRQSDTCRRIERRPRGFDGDPARAER